MCTPGVPGVYHVFFSGEDGDLTILDPYFCQKFVKICQKFAKNSREIGKCAVICTGKPILTRYFVRKFAKFVKIGKNLGKICQNWEKVRKICPKNCVLECVYLVFPSF